MGKINLKHKIKLICGILYNPDFFEKTEINSLIEKEFQNFLGKEIKIDLISETINFDCTDYYNEEMGEKILRYWISFTPTIEAKQNYKIKIFTNNLEQKFFSDSLKNRKVNLDPGYIEGSKLVLFSTKNYSHRIYLDEGIFAEVTLIYKNKNWQILEWTYPDYKIQVALKFFSEVRQKMLKETTEHFKENSLE